jgi:hypothetical protein
MINKLNVFADVAEWTEWYMMELACNFMIPTKQVDEPIVMVFYGRNYIIEPVSALLERYHTSKEKGDNTAILDKQLYEWVVSKYKTDVDSLNNELKRIKVEPYIHYTIDEVEKIFDKGEAQKKILFSRFWLNADYKKDDAVLRSEFDAWIKQQPEYEDYEDVEETEEAASGGNIQAEALNGAQVTSMVEIVTAVSEKRMPKETGRALIKASFPLLTDEQVNDIINPI